VKRSFQARGDGGLSLPNTRKDTDSFCGSVYWKETHSRVRKATYGATAICICTSSTSKGQKQRNWRGVGNSTTNNISPSIETGIDPIVCNGVQSIPSLFITVRSRLLHHFEFMRAVFLLLHGSYEDAALAHSKSSATV
jgi:hypothetical protein